ncbi:MAG: cold shock domain-containing protein [Syntrophobacteraceae bacterium]|jgi:cold shock CspA family protein
MAKARVKWFNKNNCFGFIEMDDGTEALVHFCSNEAPSIEEGDQLNFELDCRGKTARIRKL